MTQPLVCPAHITLRIIIALPTRSIITNELCSATTLSLNAYCKLSSANVVSYSLLSNLALPYIRDYVG